MDLLSGLDLFSGIGGISVALSDYVRTIAYCEQDKYAQGVLLSRMYDNQLHRAPIWDNVTTLKGDMLPRIDIIFGGFPCQDLSLAGAGKGLAGERSGLFYEIIRLTKEINPTFVFLENVPAIRTRGLSEVIRAFTEVGYDCRWACLSASELGAPHKRERWFLLAHTNSKPVREKQIIGGERKSANEFRLNGEKKPLADTNGIGLETIGVSERNESKIPNSECNNIVRISTENKSPWETGGEVCRVDDGVPFRVERLKCLGNSVVPLQAKKAFKKLMGLDINKTI